MIRIILSLAIYIYIYIIQQKKDDHIPKCIRTRYGAWYLHPKLWKLHSWNEVSVYLTKLINDCRILVAFIRP